MTLVQFALTTLATFIGVLLACIFAVGYDKYTTYQDKKEFKRTRH